MRRLLFAILGLIEVAAALALFALGVSLPGNEDLRNSFEGARRVAAASGDQVRLFREQVAGLPRARIRRTAGQLQDTNRILTATLQRTRVDFDTVRAIRDATSRSAEGLEGLSRVLDPATIGRLGDALRLRPGPGRSGGLLPQSSHRSGLQSDRTRFVIS